MARGRRTSTALSEINVIPLVDVMLVLLIVFMVAAPLATVDIAVDLPRSTASAQPRPEAPLYLTLQRDLTLSLGDAPILPERLAAALDAATAVPVNAMAASIILRLIIPFLPLRLSLQP